MIIRTYIPKPPLSDFVEVFWLIEVNFFQYSWRCFHYIMSEQGRPTRRGSVTARRALR